MVELEDKKKLILNVNAKVITKIFVCLNNMKFLDQGLSERYRRIKR